MYKSRESVMVCIETNEGGDRICDPKLGTYYPKDMILEDGEPVDVNRKGFRLGYPTKDGQGYFIAHPINGSPTNGIRCRGIMISFAGVKSNHPIGTLKSGRLLVRPQIGISIDHISTSQIPDSYREISMTGIYIDINKVDVQLSRPVKFDGVVRTKVTSLFKGTLSLSHVSPLGGAGPKVENIHNGVCRFCHQNTNHPYEKCPSRDVGMEPQGPFKWIPIELKPLCKENARDNGIRFYSAPEGGHDNELQAKFEEYGEVKRLYIADRETASSKRSGVVAFVNIDDAERALNALKDEFQMHWFV